MLGIILMSFVSIGVLIYEGRYLIQRKLWGELRTVIVLVVLGFVLAVGPALGINIPKIPKLIMAFTNGLLSWLGISIDSR